MAGQRVLSKMDNLVAIARAKDAPGMPVASNVVEIAPDEKDSPQAPSAAAPSGGGASLGQAVPHRPVELFPTLMQEHPQAMVLLRSHFVTSEMPPASTFGSLAPSWFRTLNRVTRPLTVPRSPRSGAAAPMAAIRGRRFSRAGTSRNMASRTDFSAAPIQVTGYPRTSNPPG